MRQIHLLDEFLIPVIELHASVVCIRLVLGVIYHIAGVRGLHALDSGAGCLRRMAANGVAGAI